MFVHRSKTSDTCGSRCCQQWLENVDSGVWSGLEPIPTCTGWVTPSTSLRLSEPASLSVNWDDGRHGRVAVGIREGCGSKVPCASSECRRSWDYDCHDQPPLLVLVPVGRRARLWQGGIYGGSLPQGETLCVLCFRKSKLSMTPTQPSSGRCRTSWRWRRKCTGPSGPKRGPRWHSCG